MVRRLFHHYHGTVAKLTSKVGVIELNVAAASIVQDLELILVGLGNIGEVLVVGSIDLLGVGLALLVTQVVPVGGGQGEFHILDLLRGYEAGQVLELVDIGAADVLDLARADHGLTGLVTGLKEGSNIGGIGTEALGVNVVHLLESLQTREEGSPEH